MPAVTIHTVGDLIDKLEEFDRNAPVRMLIEFELMGIIGVRDLAGRISIIPTKIWEQKKESRHET